MCELDANEPICTPLPTWQRHHRQAIHMYEKCMGPNSSCKYPRLMVIPPSSTSNPAKSVEQPAGNEIRHVHVHA